VKLDEQVRGWKTRGEIKHMRGDPAHAVLRIRAK
jgi:hypothetical protein